MLVLHRLSSRKQNWLHLNMIQGWGNSIDLMNNCSQGLDKHMVPSHHFECRLLDQVFQSLQNEQLLRHLQSRQNLVENTAWGILTSSLVVWQYPCYLCVWSHCKESIARKSTEVNSRRRARWNEFTSGLSRLMLIEQDTNTSHMFEACSWTGWQCITCRCRDDYTTGCHSRFLLKHYWCSIFICNAVVGTET